MSGITNRLSRIKSALKHEGGFTLLELMIVLAILSIMSLIVLPRVSSIGREQKDNLLIVKGIIAKTFDDAYLNGNINFLTVHLMTPGELSNDSLDESYSERNNAISILQIDKNGVFKDNPNKILKSRKFSENFKLEEVLFENGEKIGLGNVLIPFYPQGYSDNIIIHILVNDQDKWSIKIDKFQRDVKIVNDYITFSDQ